MNQASAKNQLNGNWYLFIGDGICLKVSSDLVLGEDEEGLVVLNPKQAGYGLLRMRTDEAGRLLLKNISKLHVLDWQKGTATMVGREFALVAQSKIELPNNELYLNHDMQRGQVSAHIIVQECEPVLEQVEVLVEVLPEAPQPEPAVERVIAEKLLDQEVFAEPPTPRPSVKQLDSSAGENRIFLIGAVVSICLVVGLLIGTWSSARFSQKPAIVTPDVASAADTLLPSTAEPAPTEVIPVEAPIVQSTETEPEPKQVSEEAEAMIVEAATVEPETDEPFPLEPAVVDPAIAEALARATAYLEQGSITQPSGGNAVLELSNILWQDPTNQAAFDLMGEATTILIDAAVEAHSAGFEYEARNLLEEVLGFNPQHPQANAYKREWAGN